MRLVETILRPARIAWVLPTDASARAANRTFRLASGRWGGRFDIIIQRDVGEPLSDFAASALALADPDFLFSVDRELARHSWGDELAQLRIQPFDVAHIGGRDAADAAWGGILRGRPTVGDDDEPVKCRAARGSTFDWRLAAEQGLLDRRDRFFEIGSPDDELPTLLEAASEGLAPGPARLGGWVLVGDQNLELACRYWTLRALGARVIWRPNTLLDARGRFSVPDRFRLGRAVISAPGRDPADVAARLRARGARQVRFAEDDLRRDNPAPLEGAEYARQALAVAPHQDRLHFALPTPDGKGRPLSAFVAAVVEHRLRSLDPSSPDGVMLSTDAVSRELLGRGGSAADVRVTKRGLAARQRLANTSLQSVPLIGFRDAVAAPLEAAGYRVELSDKGRFQTKALQQARGLRFLAWVLCQQESRDLLALFDEHHIAGEKLKDSYRRSVTYEELRTRLRDRLRGDGRLTAPRKQRGDEWLRRWADELLDRGMLVGGFHLKCAECLYGDFYPADRIDARFECNRCTATRVVPADAERRLRLGELFDTLRRQHGDVVSLVLAWLRQEAKESLLYLPEIDLFRGGDLIAEADFAALVDGRLAVGEAKSARRIMKKEIDKLAAVARRSGASRLLFATLDDDPHCGTARCAGCAEDGDRHPDHAWDTTTRKHIRAVRAQLAGVGVEVRTLRRPDLLDDPGKALGELAMSTRARETTRPTRSR